jgi:hypothetical protein
VFPLILQAHMFIVHVLHFHHTITNLFLVSLNERESQGTAADSCYCAVIDVAISSPPAESHPALDTKILTPTVYGESPVRKLQLSRTPFRPHNLLFYNNNLSIFDLGNSTANSLHVLSNFQHVSLIMLAKSGHVATVVAIITFVNSLVKAELVLTCQCLYQWDEGFECSLPQPSNFAKVDRQDSIGPGLNWFLQSKN